MVWFVIILLTILVLILAIHSLYGLFAFFSGAPFVPTGSARLATMLALAEIKPNELVLDAGSGDGRVVFAVAGHCRRAVGIEINPVLYWYAKIKKKLLNKNNRLTKVEFYRQNLWRFNLAPVDIMMLYFIPDKMERLMHKIKREMKPGARVVSHAFTFPGWQYEKKDGKVYLYKI